VRCFFAARITLQHLVGSLKKVAVFVRLARREPLAVSLPTATLIPGATEEYFGDRNESRFTFDAWVSPAMRRFNLLGGKAESEGNFRERETCQLRCNVNDLERSEMLAMPEEISSCAKTALYRQPIPRGHAIQQDLSARHAPSSTPLPRFSSRALRSFLSSGSKLRGGAHVPNS